MKDLNDKHTVDGFADLLRDLDKPAEDAPSGVPLSDLAELIAHVAERNGIDMPKPVPGASHKPAKAKPGPKPKHGETMSGAERAKAFRDRKRAEKQAEADRLEAIRQGKPVTSSVIDLNSSFSDVYKQTRGGAAHDFEG